LAYSTQMGNRLLARSSGVLYDYSAQHQGFISRGPVAAVPTSSQIVKSGNTDFPAVDAFATPKNNFTGYVWYDGTNINVQMIDQISGTVLSQFNAVFGNGVGGTDIQIIGTEQGNTTHFWVRFGRTVLHYSKTTANTGFLADAGNPYDYFVGTSNYRAARMCVTGAVGNSGWIFVGLYGSTTAGVVR